MISLANKTSLIPDLFFCVVFMPILVVLSPAHYWISQFPIFFTIACTYMYVCYFLMVNINVPGLLISRRYARIAGIMIALVAVNYVLSRYPLPAMDFVTPALSEYQTRVRNFGVSVAVWLMFSLVMGYSLTVSFIKELYGQLLLKRKLEAQRNKAELAVFKAQISPHFLFNTLNSLYSLVIGTSQKAEDAFIKFTDILKYTYVTIEKETVPLRDEITYISNYIDLQAIRLNTHTRVEWDHQVADDSILIPPMLMLTFVENAFKYGASTCSDCTISIRLHVSASGILEFETRNSIMKHADEFRQDIPVGVENCRARLCGLFPGRHSLTTHRNDSDNTFSVNLKINLD